MGNRPPASAAVAGEREDASADHHTSAQRHRTRQADAAWFVLGRVRFVVFGALGFVFGHCCCSVGSSPKRGE